MRSARRHPALEEPGVAVAAPIAMVGYTLLRVLMPVSLPAADYARPGRQLYRFSTTWVSAGGTTIGLISAPTSSTVNQQVTFTATVNATNSGIVRASASRWISCVWLSTRFLA